MSWSLTNPLPSLPNAFGALVEVTIEKTAPNTSALTVMSPPPDTLRPLVCLSNVTFAVAGNIVTDSALQGSVTFVIKEVTSLMIVPPIFFSRSRLPISLGLPPRSNWNIPYGVLIEPGVRLYEGGNVMVCLLADGVFLFSFYRRTHDLFGMFSYNWIHCLLLFDSSNTVLIELWLHAILFYSSLISIYLSVDSLLPSIQFCCIGYMSWLTHNLSTCSMMFYAYVYSSISSLPHIPYSSFLIYAI